MKVSLFGNAHLGTVSLTNTCGEWDTENTCMTCWGSEDGNPASFHQSVPGFVGSGVSFDWGQQGANVVVSGCGSIFPAQGKILFGETSAVSEYSWSYTCPNYENPITGVFDGWAEDVHYQAAFFDPNVFVVNGQRVSPILVGSISVTLVNDDCETLKKAMNAKVKIYHQKKQSASACGSCGSCDPSSSIFILPIQEELTRADLIAEVGVIFTPSDLLEQKCPDPGTPDGKPDTESNSFGGGNCSSCSGGGSGSGDLSVGNASVDIGFDLSGTLSMYGSPDINMTTVNCGTPEINAPGAWLRATHYPFSTSNVDYDTTVEGDVITAINYSFEVSAWGRNTYHYEYGMTGGWVDQTSPSVKSKEQVALEAFLEEASGKVRLMYVINPTYATNPKQGIILEFEYDSNGNIEKQTSYDENGIENGAVIYGYDSNGSLARIWAGTNENEYIVPGSGDPTGGRWIDVSYSGTGNKKTLDSIEYGGCSSCRALRIYEKGGPDGNLLTKIKKTDGTVLATYDYDEQGRYKSYTIGSGTNELKVNEWQRSEYNPNDPNGTTGDNMILRKDYVDNTKYRAKVFFADNKGALTKEIHYHQLQDDPDRLRGPYSVYRYYHEKVSGILSYVTEYPKGNKIRKYYDNFGNVAKVQWDGVSVPMAEYQYTYHYYNDQVTDPNMRYAQLVNETNAYGGITSYTYSGINVETRTEPVPGAGISGSSSQVTTYAYDAENRVKYESKKDSQGALVYTRYVYDSNGNLKRIHENCTYADCTGSNPTTGLITTHEYNEYNQLEKTIYPSGKVERKFYSDAGTLIAEAVYDNATTNNGAVSATIYEYEDGKLETKKTAKMNAPFAFDGTVGTTITWISETYEYDDYGRREAVIADATGEALRTEYEYNNQGEVIKVLNPDKRYKKTLRDGRGLVVKEITGVEINGQENDKAETQYFYDLNGNLIKKIDPEDVTELYQYDSKDRMIRSRRGK